MVGVGVEDCLRYCCKGQIIIVVVVVVGVGEGRGY